MGSVIKWGGILSCMVLLSMSCAESGGSDPSGTSSSDDTTMDAGTTSEGEVLEDGVEPNGETDGEDTSSEVSDEVDTASGQSEEGWHADLLDLGEEFVLRGVWGESPDALVAVGNKSTILEYQDGEWTIVHQNTELDTLNAVWGSSMNDVWAVGAHGALLHRDASGWNIGTACTNDAACDDGDSCTIDTCGPDGQCFYAGSGQPGCCGTVVFSENFESGTLSSWTVTDTSPGKTGMVWHNAGNKDPKTGEPRATSGTQALYFGDSTKPCEDDASATCPDFDNGQVVASTVLSQPIQVPNSANVEVRFQVFIDTESGGSWDKLELHVLAGNLDTIVWTKEDVGGTTGGQFTAASADISSYSGQTIRLQFAFDSDDPLVNDGEGVYIDDLAVDTVCGDASAGNRYPTLWGIWGTASDDIFAVGNEGTILHYDGSSWKRQAGGDARDLFTVAVSEEHVVAGGADGEVFTSFGSGLSVDTAGTSSTLRSMALYGGDVAIAVGTNGTIVRHEGGTWSTQDSPVPFDLFDLWTDGTTSIAVGGSGTSVLKEGDGAWSSVPTGQTGTLYAVWGSSATNVYAVGEPKGLLMHYDGTSWSKEGNLTTADELRGIYGFGIDGPYIAVGGGGTVVRYADGVWAGEKSPTSLVLHDVWGATADDVWAVGNLGVIIHWDGEGWTEVTSPTTLNLYGLAGRSADEVYAVGADGMLLRWDGTEWSLIRSNTTANLRSVWGRSSDDVYAVGAGATIMHFNGLNWAQVKVEDEIVGGAPQAVTAQMYDVWGPYSTNIFAVGVGGVLIHREIDDLTGEATWIKVPQQDNEITIRGFWGADEENMWMVGRQGTILHFDGQFMTPEPTESIATLYDVIGFAGGYLVAVGDLGTILRRTPSATE